MKCPQCNDEFSLTWGLYLSAPFGRFKCPCCEAKLKGTHRWFYYPAAVLGICVLTIPFYFLWGWSGLLIGALISVPIDREVEKKFSILVINRKSKPLTSISESLMLLRWLIGIPGVLLSIVLVWLIASSINGHMKRFAKPEVTKIVAAKNDLPKGTILNTNNIGQITLKRSDFENGKHIHVSSYKVLIGHQLINSVGKKESILWSDTDIPLSE